MLITRELFDTNGGNCCGEVAVSIEKGKVVDGAVGDEGVSNVDMGEFMVSNGKNCCGVMGVGNI